MQSNTYNRKFTFLLPGYLNIKILLKQFKQSANQSKFTYICCSY